MSWHIRTELDEIWDKLTDEQRQEVLEHARKVAAGDTPKPKKMGPMDWFGEHTTIDTDGDHVATGWASTEWRHATDSRISSMTSIGGTSSRIVELGDGTYSIESTDGELVNLSINDSPTSDF